MNTYMHIYSHIRVYINVYAHVHTHPLPSNVSNGSNIKYYFRDHNKKC